MVNEDTTIELRTVTKWNCHRVEIIVQIQLLEEKSSYQCRQLRLLDISYQICYIFWALPFYNTNIC